jgi:hypothetical protein
MIFDFGLPEDLKRNSEFFNQFQVWEKQIKANYDCRVKEIGDRVIVWDSSGSCDLNGNLYYESENFFREEMIVIATNTDYQISIPYLGSTHDLDLDLILYCPSCNKTVRSNSDFCRIINVK